MVHYIGLIITRAVRPIFRLAELILVALGATVPAYYLMRGQPMPENVTDFLLMWAVFAAFGVAAVRLLFVAPYLVWCDENDRGNLLKNELDGSYAEYTRHMAKRISKRADKLSDKLIDLEITALLLSCKKDVKWDARDDLERSFLALEFECKALASTFAWRGSIYDSVLNFIETCKRLSDANGDETVYQKEVAAIMQIKPEMMRHLWVWGERVQKPE